jgi:UDP-N-acetylmuramyl pentapeptide synthase
MGNRELAERIYRTVLEAGAHDIVLERVLQDIETDIAAAIKTAVEESEGAAVDAVLNRLGRWAKHYKAVHQDERDGLREPPDDRVPQ